MSSPCQQATESNPKNEGPRRNAHSQPLAAVKSHARSRLTNHKDLLPEVDGRSLIARRYRDIVAAIIGDQGGLDGLSEARLQLVRRFAACAVLLEGMEASLARGEELGMASTRS